MGQLSSVAAKNITFFVASFHKCVPCAIFSQFAIKLEYTTLQQVWSAHPRVRMFFSTDLSYDPFA
jgi:hypothetical protein